MKNLFYLLFVLPLLFSCGDDSSSEENDEKSGNSDVEAFCECVNNPTRDCEDAMEKLEEEFQNSLEFKRKITLSKDNMDRFFIENSYLKEPINFNDENRNNKREEKEKNSKLETNKKDFNFNEFNKIFKCYSFSKANIQTKKINFI